MNASKKSISAHQLHRKLGITYKAAWFMAHRLRYAATGKPLGQLLVIVEADETYISGKMRVVECEHGFENKTTVFALIERGGELRAGKVKNVCAKTLNNVIRDNITPDSRIMTDSFLAYNGQDKELPAMRQYDMALVNMCATTLIPIH